MLYDTGDLISCDSSIHCSPSLTCLTRLSQDTLRDCDQESTCYNTVISPIYFVSFVLTAQFVLVNVVIAVLMKHLEESNKEAKEEAELEAELELEMKTLSPQPHSPLGSPFLWPGVEGPESPDSPKPGAPLAVAHAGAASRFSLEHPTVSTHPPPLRGVGDGDGWAAGWCAGWAAQQTQGSGSFCCSCLDVEGPAVPNLSPQMAVHIHCPGPPQQATSAGLSTPFASGLAWPPLPGS